MDGRLRGYLWRWALWLRLTDSVAWSAWGLLGGLGAGLALAVAARIWPLLTRRPLLGLAGLLALSGALIGLAAAWLRPLLAQRLARILDRRLGLAERLTTAFEIGLGRLRAAPGMAAAQLADTLAAAARVDVRAALPLRVPRRAALGSAVLLAALALSLILPNPQEAVLAHKAAVRQAVEEQIDALETAQQEVASSETLTPEEQAALLEALQQAIEALEEGQATPEEAVAALAQAERALAPLQDPGAAGVQAGLEQAAAAMDDSELTQALAEALAQGNYEQAAQELAAFAGAQGEALTREQELELAAELAQAAAELAESDPELAAQLAEAAQAIEQGDIAQAREAIEAAAEQMAADGQRVERQEEVEETLSTLQQGREEVAQAGGQPGEQGGEQAGGQPGGQGEQAGGQQGDGQPGGQQGQQTEPGHHEDSGTGAPYDEVYVPGRIGEDGTPLDVGREGDEGQPTGENPVPITGRSSMPYRDVYGSYADAAYAALEGSYIPLGMKQYVRDYFSSLEP